MSEQGEYNKINSDLALYEEVLTTYDNDLFRHCYRVLGCFYDAEEVTQETFLKVYQNLYKFNEIKQVKPWLFRIATNLCIDKMRKKKPLAILDQAIKGSEYATRLDQVEGQALNPEESVITNERDEQIWDYIKALPPKYRSVILLRYFQEFSINEISITLNIPVGTVKTRIYRGKEVLKKKFVNGKTLV
ncbi:sigma-70 family RNA polymerase sigma factor [Alkalibacillus haloalkaliphilus]|uniref:RNA polymerase sigma factor n=1 Tax=Alkalibacillus haloalkaliphilus TaxID=94136 RepID=A0A511W7V2_9BACI|nr:sigma-70 family RNA polymerase sigma factor [Alkalibacillus haloalkaliphilus]GEN46408.1 ECF RNA polymerase sigma factor SigW [Alkalibacillus haloalkaliphilus]